MEMWLSGFFFLFILVVYLILLPALGYKVDIDDLDAELQKINNDRKKFQISIGLALIHNICVIILAILLFIIFSPYNIILGIILITFRIGEGVILIYNDKCYRGLLKIARKYSDTSENEENSLSDRAHTIIKTKSYRFAFALIFWSIGTLAFSIVLVIYELELPIIIIGWLGIVGSILTGIGNGIILIKHKKVFLESIGGLVALLFEILIGVWLLYYSLIIP